MTRAGEDHLGPLCRDDAAEIEGAARFAASTGRGSALHRRKTMRHAARTTRPLTHRSGAAG